jgi:hypothetical protein
MFIMSIVLFLGFVAALIQAFKEYKKDRNMMFFVVFACVFFASLVFSIVGLVQEFDEKETSAKLAADNHTELIDSARSSLRHVDTVLRHVDTVLGHVDSVLHTSDSILSNTGTTINKLTRLQRTAKGLNDSLAYELQIQRKTNQETKEILYRSERVATLLITDSTEKIKNSSYAVHLVVMDAKRDLMHFVNSRVFDSNYLVSEAYKQTISLLLRDSYDSMSPLTDCPYLREEPVLKDLWMKYTDILNSLLRRIADGGEDYAGKSLYERRKYHFGDFLNAYYIFRDYFFGPHYLDEKQPPVFNYWNDISKRQ